MTEEDYRQLLAELGFDMDRHTAPDVPPGQALRHRTRRFPNIHRRNTEDPTIFWPTLYWVRTASGLIYFVTRNEDVACFSPEYWVPLSPEMVKGGDAGISFVPVNRRGIGAREALQSLFDL